MITVNNTIKSKKEIIIIINDWINNILANWKLIVLAGVIGAGLGLSYSILRKTIYVGTLSFVLEDEKTNNMGGALSMVSQLGFDIGSGTNNIFSGINLMELMKSRNLTEKALLDTIVVNGKKISFAEHYIAYNKWRDDWDDDPQLKNIQFPPCKDRIYFTLKQDSILGEIYKKIVTDNLSVSQKNSKVSIIYVDVKSENELFSKFFTEALVREASQFYIEIKSKKAKLNVNVLLRQTDSVKVELTKAITGVAVANDNTFNLNPSQNINRVPTVRMQVDVQANTAILTELVKNLEIAKLNLRKETPLVRVIDKPILPLDNNKMRKIKGLLGGGFLGGSLVVIFLSLIMAWKSAFEE